MYKFQIEYFRNTVNRFCACWPFLVTFFIMITPGVIRGLASGSLSLILPAMGVGMLVGSAATFLCGLIGKRWIQVLFLAFASPLFATYMFLWIEFGLIISPETLQLAIETNSTESKEFFFTFISGRGGGLILCATLALWMLYFLLEHWRLRGYALLPGWLSKHTYILKFFFVSGCLSFSVYGFFVTVRFADIYKTSDFDGLENFISDNSESFGHAYSDLITSLLYSFKYLEVSRSELNGWEELNRDLRYDSVTSVNDSIDVVYVIGESYIRDHASLYGYPLPTTPFIQKEEESGNLIKFSDMISTGVRTTYVMRLLLTANDNLNGRRWENSPYLPMLFKLGGFDVSLYENQQQFGGKTNPFTTGLSMFILNPLFIDSCYTYINHQEYPYDRDLVKELADGGLPLSGSNLYILHLMGQHVNASARYPLDWDKPFDASDIAEFRDQGWLDSDMLQKIAEYDNATAYNDIVLKDIFDIFRDRKAVVVYVSDHGEEIYDYRPMQGRRDAPYDQLPDKAYYQNSVPCIVWFSNSYAEAYPDRVESLAKASCRPGVSDDIPNMIMSLAGLGGKWYDEQRDILSDMYRAPIRKIYPSGDDYDGLMHRGNNKKEDN